MNYFIVGDIHGCYYTLKEILSQHWNKEEEKLILLGDLVNKGKHTFAVLEFIIKLKEQYPNQVVVLKGNNEYLFEKYYRDSITLSAKQKFENYNLDYIDVLNWIDNLPHCYENGKVFFSHAGVGIDIQDEINNDNLDLIFNRKQLKNIQKTQFLSHIVVDKPKYDKNANAWYLDTGAGYGKKLTGAKVKENGDVTEFVSMDVHIKDIPRFN